MASFTTLQQFIRAVVRGTVNGQLVHWKGFSEIKTGAKGGDSFCDEAIATQ